MIDLNIEVDLSGLQQALKSLSSGKLPNTAAAVHAATLLVQRTWLQAASGREMSYEGRVFSLKRVSGAYAKSIEQGLSYPDGDDLSGRVTASAPYAAAIEEGTPPRDMKPGLLSGPKARRGKDGTTYAIIPFRHGNPNAVTLPAMPREIYNQARKMAHSQITGSYQDANIHGAATLRAADQSQRGRLPAGLTTRRAGVAAVTRNTYRWGERLGKTDIGWRSRIAPEEHQYTHTTSIYSGMVRMGSPRHSTFMTFRVVSTNSPSNSWWSPGTDPKPVAAAVAQMTEPQVTVMIRAAFEADLALLGVA